MFLNRKKYTGITFVVFALLFMTISCNKDKNPVTPHEEHNEAEGMVLKVNDTNIVVVKEGKVESGKITVKAGESIEEITARFLDHDGDEFIPDEEGSSLALEIAESNTAEATMVSGEEWKFKVTGKRVGSTAIVVKLMHHDHSDFTTPAIVLEVTN